MTGYKINDVRNKILGLKLIDFIDDGKVLFFEDGEGRSYSIDFTADGAIVHRGSTKEEEMENKSMLFDLLLQKLDISEEELWELYE